MKKLYLLLSSAAVSLLVASSLTVTVAGCDHKKDDTTTKVHDALKKLDQKHPLEIPYNQKNPKAPASDPAVTKVIRDQLKSKNPTIFTSTVAAEITFSNTPLQENTAVEVQATYNKKATSIYVKEAKKAKDPDQVIYDALKEFNYKNPIVIFYNKTNPTAPASDPAITKLIRNQLKQNNPTIFTSTVVAEITFSNTPLQENTAVQVKATYKEQATPIYVKAKNLDQGVYDALASFDQKHPLKIPYNQKKPKAPASDPAVTKVIRDQLKSKNPTIFTSTVVAEITFNNTPLQENTAVEVQATYKEKATSIYVKEENLDQGVYDALASFDQNSPIKIPYNQKKPKAPASDPAVTKVIRDQLKSKNPTIFTSTVVAEITFSNTPLQENTPVEVQATYKEKATPIYVLEKPKKISKIEKKVKNVLQRFSSQSNRLKILTRGSELKASDIKGSKLIRDALLEQGKRGGLTPALAIQITFGDDIIGKVSATLPIQVE